MDNVVKILNRQCEIGSSSNVSATCCTFCGVNHDDTNCVNFEQVQYVNNFNCSNQNNSHSNMTSARYTYNN